MGVYLEVNAYVSFFFAFSFFEIHVITTKKCKISSTVSTLMWSSIAAPGDGQFTYVPRGTRREHYFTESPDGRLLSLYRKLDERAAADFVSEIIDEAHFNNTCW